MKFDIYELEEKLYKIGNDLKLENKNLENTYLKSKESICELYLIFILFSFIKEEYIMNEYDVD